MRLVLIALCALPIAANSLVRKRGEAVEIACLKAQSILGEDKVDTVPLDQDVVNENWSQACRQEPHCIIQPTAPEDVSKALTLIKHHGVPFAVRSGGHSPSPNHSSIDKTGILFDMSKLNSVSLSHDGLVASVGPGAHWADVSAALSVHGVSAVGARAPYVGVGGLLLIGGYSYFASEHGLASDNVKNFEIVLADGSLTNANHEQNPDLFWALKGGGPNFGIVTRYDLHTIPVNQMWYNALIFSPDQSHDLLEALAEWQKNGASDVKSNVLMSAGLDTALLLLTYAAPAEKPKAFMPFFELTPLQVVIPGTNGTLDSLNQIINIGFAPAEGRHDYRGAGSKIDSSLYHEMYDYWHERAVEARESYGVNQTFTIQHVSRKAAQKANEMGGNPLNLPDEDHQWWTTLIDWEDETNDDAARSVSIETTKQWNKLAADRGLDIDFLYAGDASRDQEPIKTYGIENVKRLQKIAKRYDPDGVFQNLQKGGFLLSNLCV